MMHLSSLIRIGSVILISVALAATGAASAVADTGNTVTGSFTFGGVPIPNASINYKSSDGSGGNAITDANGNYTINNVPDGSYTVTLNGGNGVAVPSFDAATSSTAGLTVNAPNTTQNLAFNKAVVTVTVKDSGGALAQGANVTAITFNGDGSFSDASGAFQFPARVDTLETFGTTSNGTVSIPVIPGVAYNFCASLSNGARDCDPNVTVNSDTSIEIDFPALFSVSGQMTFGNTPVANANIEYSSGTSSGSATTDANGNYTINNLPRGSYTVDLNGGNGKTVPSFDAAISSTAGLTVNGQNVSQNLTFNQASVAVTVNDGNGNPINGAEVTAITFNGDGPFADASGAFQFPARVDTLETFGTTNNGMVSIPVIPGVAYNFCASLSNGSRQCDSNVNITGDTSLEIDFPSQLNISGQMTFGSTPAPNASISYRSSTGAGGNATTDANGNYTINNVPNGSYGLILNVLGNGSTVPGIDAAQSSNMPLVVNGASVVQNLNFDIAQVTVTVRDGSNLISGVPVSINTFNGDGSFTDASGTFRFPAQVDTVENFGTTSNGTVTIPVIPGIQYNICASLSGGGVACIQKAVNADMSVVIDFAPPAPTNLIALSPTNTDPYLSWDSVAEATSYNIYRDGTKLASSTTNSYTDTTAAEGAHSYFVTAVNAGGESAPSNTVSVLVDRTAPVITYAVDPAPNANGWNNSQVTVNFMCTDNPGGSGLFSCTSPQTLTTEGASQQVTGTAVDNAGNNASVTATVSIDETPPALGTASLSADLIVAGQSTDLSIPVSDGLSGVVGGEYYIGSTDPGQGDGTAMTLSSSTLTAALGSDLGPGTYTVNYRAEDAAGNWDAPQGITLTVQPSAPANLTAPSPTNAAPALSWSSVAGADHYDVYRDGTKIGSSTSSTYTDTNANEGTHSYFVTAVGASGISSNPSNTITVLVDTTPPIVVGASFSTDPKSVSQGSDTLTAQVTDPLSNNTSSGINDVQYYDPVQQTWLPMSLSGDVASATVATSPTAYPSGMYIFQVRSSDNAGNASQPINVYLDVYNPSGGYAAGHGTVVPNGSTSNPGDTLPAETGNNVRADFNFTVKYAGSTDTTPTGSSMFTWGSSCNNPHSDCLTMTADFSGTVVPSWLIVNTTTDTATFQGAATLNQGATSLGSNYPVRVTTSSGAISGAASHYLLQIYPVGSNPDTATPLYQASGDLTGGQVVVHG